MNRTLARGRLAPFRDPRGISGFQSRNLCDDAPLGRRGDNPGTVAACARVELLHEAGPRHYEIAVKSVASKLSSCVTMRNCEVETTTKARWRRARVQLYHEAGSHLFENSVKSVVSKLASM